MMIERPDEDLQHDRPTGPVRGAPCSGLFSASQFACKTMLHARSFMESLMKYIIVAVASAMTLALAGCNTVAGFGKDVQRAGQAVQRAAN